MEFALFSRSTCHLCEEMEDELRPYIQKYSITVKRQFIDNDADLEKRYGNRVPVLMFQDKVLCEYFLDPKPLLDVITAQKIF